MNPFVQGGKGPPGHQRRNRIMSRKTKKSDRNTTKILHEALTLVTLTQAVLSKET